MGYFYFSPIKIFSFNDKLGWLVGSGSAQPSAHITDLDNVLASPQFSISSSLADLKLQLVSSFPLVIQ